MFTSSSLVCRQGKEKVKPTGSFLSLMLCFSMKFPRHSATWSNSWRRGAEGQGEGSGREAAFVFLDFEMNSLLFRCRAWFHPACRRPHSPSERSAYSRGSLWHGGSGTHCLPDPKRWNRLSLSIQRRWKEEEKRLRCRKECTVLQTSLFRLKLQTYCKYIYFLQI